MLRILQFFSVHASNRFWSRKQTDRSCANTAIQTDAKLAINSGQSRMARLRPLLLLLVETMLAFQLVYSMDESWQDKSGRSCSDPESSGNASKRSKLTNMDVDTDVNAQPSRNRLTQVMEGLWQVTDSPVAGWVVKIIWIVDMRIQGKSISAAHGYKSSVILYHKSRQKKLCKAPGKRHHIDIRGL